MKIEMEKVIKALTDALSAKRNYPWAKAEMSFEFIEMLLELLKAQRKVIRDLCTLGYPHNFQHEAPWVAQYCRDVSEVITEAFEVNDNDDT